MTFIKGGFLVKTLIRKEGKVVKIRKATMHRDEDRGTSYITYDTTITSRALVSNIGGWIELVFPFGRAYDGDLLMLFKEEEDLSDNDRILYENIEYKINEHNERDFFRELVVERI